jgi:hypothetical protein
MWGALDQTGNQLHNLYKYDIDSDEWSIVKTSSTDLTRRLAYGFCEYKDNLYIIRGYNQGNQDFSNSTYRINLKSDAKKWENFNVGNFESYGAFGYVCYNDKVYIYSGLSNIGYTNQLVELNLENSGEVTVLSEFMKIPIPRYGHGMIVYDEKLLILGGVDKDGNE